MNQNRILFFTNTPPEYRIPLYQKLTSLYPITFVFTQIDLAKKIYKNDLDNSKLNKIRYYELPKRRGRFKEIKKLICDKNVKGIVIPPLDSVKETIYAYWIYFWAKKKEKKTLYFWGKWEAPKKYQPLKKRLKNSFQRFIAKPIIKGTDTTIGYGKKACDYLVSNGANLKTCFPAYYSSMSPECSHTDWKKKNNIPEDKRCVLYFGRVIEKKGLRVLIEAIAKMDESVKEKIWLVIVGDGPDKDQLESFSRELNVKNLSWIGYVHPDRRYDYFSQCEIFVLPTYYYKGSVEAWGMTVNEAIQCGCVLVTTEAVGSSYELVNDKNGYVIKPEDSSELSEALKDAVLNKNYNFVKEENDRLLNIYNYTHSAQNLIEIFEKCINKDKYNE